MPRSWTRPRNRRRSRTRRWPRLFTSEYLRDTLTLFGSFFFCLLTVYMGTNWVPTMLVGNGFDVGTASYGLTAFNVGGVIGAILGAMSIMRLGSRISMLTMAAGAVAGAVVLSDDADRPAEHVPVFAMLGWTGGLINAVQTTMYALAAHVYPTSIRATGVGTAVGFGRIGGVLSPSVGQMGARLRRRVRLLPHDRDDDDRRVRRARRRQAAHSASGGGTGGLRRRKTESAKRQVSGARRRVHRVWRSGLDDRAGPAVGRHRPAVRLRHQDLTRPTSARPSRGARTKAARRWSSRPPTWFDRATSSFRP